ncbi:MAG: hypothetical protein GX660_22400 [Clostridiaceae bacterium]|mgnify:CR=1 FL=1|nr:hypothetical protein [Clostridiaceae bacterium]
MKYIYYLQHFYEIEDIEIVTNIAVYSSREKAEKALLKFRNHPKFANYPKCFNIDEYKIDEDNWKEGFITYE